MFWQRLIKKSRKTSRPSIGHWRGLNSENMAPVRFVERELMRTALRQFLGHLSAANMQRQMKGRLSYSTFT